MKKIWFLVITLFLVIGLSGTGQAVLLSQLLEDDGRFISGDKLFTDWKIDVLMDTAGTFGWANTEVIAIDEATDSPGLEFITHGDFFVDDENWLDVQLSFKVTVLNPNMYINGVSLGFSGVMVKEGDELFGSLAIGEDLGTTEFGKELTSFDPWVEWDPEMGISDYPDSVTIAPVTELWVLKDILLVSNGGLVDLLSFEQNFHQAPIPEPSTLLLLGLGLVAVGGYMRRKRQ